MIRNVIFAIAPPQSEYSLSFLTARRLSGQSKTLEAIP
jgi:hypothetical protein